MKQPIFIKEVGMKPKGNSGRNFLNAEYYCPICNSVFTARVYDVNSGRKRNCGCATAFKEEVLPESMNGCKVIQDLRTIKGRRSAVFQCSLCPNTFTEHVTVMRCNKDKTHCGCAKTKAEPYVYKKKDNPNWVSPARKEVKDVDHPLYHTWQSMKQRCYRATHPKYIHYGGRGITVCDAWKHSFNTFAKDMGPKPTPNHSIDRINNEGNYEPSNCRWATVKEQNNNKRKSIHK